jgi:hypothetical protein
MLLLASAAFAQEGHISASAPSWNGMEIWFVTKIEPLGARIPGGVVVEAGQVHRIINDRAHKKVFGYDVELDPSEGGKTARVRIKPFRPADSKISFEPGSAFLGLPKYPVVSNVKLGDTIALDLLINAATGQKLVDYLVLRRRGEIDVDRGARDFLLTDVELTLLDPQIIVDGKPEPATEMRGFSGAVVWLYIPRHGRFILSLIPNENLGFIKNGIVSGNGLLLHDGPVEVRVECRGQIVPSSGIYNLYIIHEPGWRPSEPAFSTMGSADKPEFVIGRK